jgi:hypothetical protein
MRARRILRLLVAILTAAVILVGLGVASACLSLHPSYEQVDRVVDDLQHGPGPAPGTYRHSARIAAGWPRRRSNPRRPLAGHTASPFNAVCPAKDLYLKPGGEGVAGLAVAGVVVVHAGRMKHRQQPQLPSRY